MTWEVEYFDDFVPERDALSEVVQNELAAMVDLLELFGPHLKRPHADTLYGSKHANMKELRFSADGGVWRVAYAFDPDRRGILLVAGDKAGKKGSAFYRRLIKKADTRFDKHLDSK